MPASGLRVFQIRIIHAALDAGVNFVDTADVYSNGESEEIVGKALKGRRDDVVLATKFFMPMGDDVNRRGPSRRWVMTAVEDSLRRLGTDHIDLYQVHRPRPRGRLRRDARRADRTEQPPYSLLTRTIELDVLPTAQHHATGVVTVSIDVHRYGADAKDEAAERFWTVLRAGRLPGRRSRSRSADG